jgi:hypothetical protein
MAGRRRLFAAALTAAVLGAACLWAASIALSPLPEQRADREPTEAARGDDDEVIWLRMRVRELEQQLARRNRPRVIRPQPARNGAAAPETGSEPATSAAVPPRAYADAVLRHWAQALGREPEQAAESLVVAVEQAPTTVPEPATPVDLTALTDEQLLEHARGIGSSKRSELIAAREAWQALVDRDPAYDVMDQALFGLGIAHRKLGEHGDELRVFERLGDLVGPHTDRGQQARYQSAWGHHFSKDHESALRDMESIVEASNGSTDRARHALLNGSSFARTAGDPARSRAMLERLLRETENESSSLSVYFAEQARTRLDRLDHLPAK